ncbi:hypothetical protein VEL88_002900 [Cronobacter sakazakii]|uniref:Uncharacterized protein n=1 Tax=Cronobacter sakazakii (strain ATCC BAA-894) TaxID=290339 RepID=A7MEP1_CROS8|nr:hypothetical protein [Cronobacter sakazakii]ABU78331.1 hypothetical protein ESA_03102 [Cronobacter sakazakii ATCC BAA-894]EKK4025025.1 hypothetical protein [Cronobacter sakazakii]EKK4074493.1 hypothetical protein [Cronobacter sakazakii]EKK7687396.1 hypothetical protein [Cronobacter sakazakii]EMC4133608.1 hypothetical protein [Cronobacter sakazakii]
MNNDELIAAGHGLAKCLDSEPLLDIAKMIVRLADKLDVTTAALRERAEPVEPIWRAAKYPVSRPVPGAKLIVWDEAGKFIGYGSAVDTRESGVAIQMCDGRRLDSNHDLRWQYALQPAPPAPVVPVETFEEWSRRCEIQLTLCRPEFREVAEITWNACRAAMLAAPGKDG